MANVSFLMVAIGLVSLIGFAGCKDPDPAADLRSSFEDLKSSTEKLDSILATIEDENAAREAVEEIKKYKKLSSEAGFEVGRMIDVSTRSATELKIQIQVFRDKRKISYQEELRRLANIPGVADVLLPVLKGPGDEEQKPQGPPGL